MNATRTSKLFYGYYVTFACFAVMFLLYGMVLNTFGIFLKPIVGDLGWGREALSRAMAVGAIGMAATAPVAGRLIDRLGAKPVMIAGTLMIGFGIVVASRISAPWEIYLIYAFIGCGLACATVIPCSLIISNWFVARRGMAMGIMAMGTSTGGMLMAPVANWIILNYGWRTAYVFSGTTILIAGTPIIVFLLRTHPSEVGLTPYVNSDVAPETAENNWGLSIRESFLSRAFWQIAAVMFIIGVVTSGLGVHCVAHFTDLGHSPTRSAFAWSIVMGVMTAGKFSFGPVADRWGAKNAMAGSCILISVSIVILALARPYTLAVVFAILYGFGVGAPLTIYPLLTGNALGMRNFGAIYGILTLISILGAAIGPVVLGVAFDIQKSYLSVFYVFVVLMALTAVISALISAAPQRAGIAYEAQPADAAK
ncbi:MAG: MFS transporter [Candidatus Hydrogenedentota bacterium]|nr:MAG: MFS transporter [Candidatus Hydrogenedentota bacterium]